MEVKTTREFLSAIKARYELPSDGRLAALAGPDWEGFRLGRDGKFYHPFLVSRFFTVAAEGDVLSGSGCLGHPARSGRGTRAAGRSGAHVKR